MPIAPDDVAFNKAAIMERSLRRAFEEYRADPGMTNWTHIDAMTLNIERSCQAAIDLALHIVARERLGMPQSSSDAFRLLKRGGLIDEASMLAMIAMTGFRNVVVHEYQALDLGVLRSIMDGGWKSLVAYCAELGLRVEIGTL